MIVDINAADDGSAFAVLLHPHPDYGGDCYHPFIDGLFRRLPEISVSAVRFNFSTSSPSAARQEVLAVIDSGASRWPYRPVIVVGYSFGAGIAATVDDGRAAGWYLLAPPAIMLERSPIRDDPRPKMILVPEYDQFSPPNAIEELIDEWRSTEVNTLPDADHFLGNVEPIVEHALGWIRSRASASVS